MTLEKGRGWDGLRDDEISTLSLVTLEDWSSGKVDEALSASNGMKATMLRRGEPVGDLPANKAEIMLCAYATIMVTFSFPTAKLSPSTAISPKLKYTFCSECMGKEYSSMMLGPCVQQWPEYRMGQEQESGNMPELLLPQTVEELHGIG